jgi:hypothetical protein
MVLFPERPITLAHIRDFCAKFNEGLRVEYKSNFDTNVRAKLPKAGSSFANSHGGVLLIGVNTINGVPQPPFEGFEPLTPEEFALTVENISLQNIYPPLFPRTTVVPSDVPNHIFIVIEIEESGEAPHAIENSRTVYVRTGNAANPYDRAEVDLIIDLVKRRKEPLELMKHLLTVAEERAGTFVSLTTPYLQISVCPRFPRNALCSAQEVWEFLRNTRYRGGSFFPRDTIRRVPDGAAGYIPRGVPVVSEEYGEINKYGLLFARKQFGVTLLRGQRAPHDRAIEFVDLFHVLFRLLVCGDRFYSATGYRGTASVRVSLQNVAGTVMSFFDSPHYTYDDFRCVADSVSVERYVPFEDFAPSKPELFKSILTEIAWSFCQAPDDFSSELFGTLIDQLVARMGTL